MLTTESSAIIEGTRIAKRLYVFDVSIKDTLMRLDLPQTKVSLLEFLLKTTERFRGVHTVTFAADNVVMGLVPDKAVRGTSILIEPFNGIRLVILINNTVKKND